MPTIPFCAIEDVYSDWNFEKTKSQSQQQRQQQQQQQQQQNHPSLKPIKQQNTGHFQNSYENTSDTSDTTYISDTTYLPPNNDLGSFCPNCNNCLRANDVLQQKIIEQNIWPRPRWTPQYPNAYVPFDPFNRYWMNNVPQSHISGIEEFGNVGIGNFEHFGSGKNNMSTESLLQIILFILVALFIIQLVECLYMRCTSD